MGEPRNSPKGLSILLPLGVGIMALVAFNAAPVAQMSELDSFQRAINTQRPQDALAFIDDYGSSHLVADLIELLKPDVAAQVCSGMRNPSAPTRSACEKVQRDIATAPAAATPAAAPATAAPKAPAAAAPAIAKTPPPPPPPALPTAGTATAATAAKPTTAPAASVAATATTPAAAAPTATAAKPTTATTATAAKPATAPTPTPAVAAPTVAIAETPLPQPAPPTPAPAPVSPSFEVVVPVEPPAPQTAAVPSPPAPETQATESNADAVGRLAARFDRGPFSIDHLDRDHGVMVVTYAGQLANYVACGDAVGSVGVATAAIDSLDRLNSRMIIRVADASVGSTGISVDAIHIVSLRHPPSQSLDVVDLRLGDAARTSQGDYCWSTGEMERLARLQ